MRVRITSWNINSVRLRLGQVARYLAEAEPDLLCLQEIKCPGELFPREAFAQLGYQWQAVVGMKGYNGVAILSRHPFAEMTAWTFCDRSDARHVGVRFDEASPLAGLSVHNLYVPAGGDLPDPDENPKFAHKLAFVEEMAERWAGGATRSVLVGDLNIAPLEHDVWSHRQLIDVVSHTPIEVEGLGRALAAGGWVDAARVLVPAEHKFYTWWSYRAPDWITADKGRRLDHVWVSSDLAAGLKSVGVLREARGWERPSDHVPLSAVIDLSEAAGTAAVPVQPASSEMAGASNDRILARTA